MSQCMRFSTMWYVRPAKPQINLRIRAVWSGPLLVTWVFYECFFMFLFCLVFAMFCARLFICALWSPAGKGLTSWLSFVVSSVSLSLSHWYPGSGVVLDCIDSWSLHHYLLLSYWLNSVWSFYALREAAEVRLSLHMSKCHIVWNIMHWLILWVSGVE